MKILLGIILALIAISLIPDKVVHYSERDALAAGINSECGNCHLADLYLTGSVILNRCGMEEFGSEIRQVLYQKGQFQGVRTKHFRPTKRSREVADDLLAGRFHIPNIIYFCTHGSKRPMKKVLIIGKSHLYGI